MSGQESSAQPRVRCKRPSCPHPAGRRKSGFCEKHYRQTVRPKVQIKRLRGHYLALREAGFSQRRIADLSGVNRDVLSRIHHADPEETVHSKTARRLLSVEIPLGIVGEGAQSVDATGTRRRIQALQAAGYPIKMIADEFGVSEQAIGLLVRGERVAASSAARVAELFEDWHMTPGPSDRARARSRRLGYPMPLDWNEDEIDDPDAEPVMVKPERADRARWVESYWELKEWGMSDKRIAERLGLRYDSMMETLRRQAA